ncbi:BON domain-containing protein [Planctomicrobium sp. SH664]|uniref:BON domain-containing protein n=1 Tax=Planctomicrobium sp. SH664 TaxID=3448125 RepID=UPI003F5CB44F
MHATNPLPKTLTLRDDVVKEVSKTLSLSPIPALKDVAVLEEGGKLVLTGRLPSYYLKQVVQTLAASVEGVRTVENRVSVIRQELRGTRASE